MKFKDMNDNLFRNIQRFFVVFFIGLCLVHYFSLRPLWLDEGYVYQSLTTYSYEQIFGPLKTQQAFPRVYLALIKFISENFEYHLLAVRFCSLAAMLTAFLCWMKIYRRSSNTSTLLWLSMFSYACSYRLIYYGAELKHYSMDVLTVALYLLFFFIQSQSIQEKTLKWLRIGSLLLPATLFFSYSALFVCWISVLNFYLLGRKDKRFIQFFILNGLSTLIFAGVFYFIDLRYSFRQSGILQYWDSYFVLTDSPLHFLDSIFEGIKRMVTYWCGTEKWQYRMAVPFIPFFLYALFRYGVKTLKEERFKVVRLESLALVLMAELLVLGLFKFYPFTGERITLFLAPFVFYLILKGMDDLGSAEILGKLGRHLRTVFLCYYFIYCGICLVNTVKVYLMLYR